MDIGHNTNTGCMDIATLDSTLGITLNRGSCQISQMTHYIQTWFMWYGCLALNSNRTPAGSPASLSHSAVSVLAEQRTHFWHRETSSTFLLLCSQQQLPILTYHRLFLGLATNPQLQWLHRLPQQCLILKCLVFRGFSVAMATRNSPVLFYTHSIIYDDIPWLAKLSKELIFHS